MTHEKFKMSEQLNSLIQGKGESELLSLYEVNHFLHEKGFALLLILFSFPMAIPLPYPPGFTTILGLPLIFYGLQMLLGRVDPWLPKFIGTKTIKISHLRFAIEKSQKFFCYIEKFSKPRLLALTSPRGEKVVGFFVLICAITIALPIWFGNAIPSLGIFVMSLGVLNRDGLAVILGVIISIIGVSIASFVVIWGVKFVKAAILKYFPNISLPDSISDFSE
jgi:hypothetical protein